MPLPMPGRAQAPKGRAGGACRGQLPPEWKPLPVRACSRKLPLILQLGVQSQRVIRGKLSGFRATGSSSSCVFNSNQHSNWGLIRQAISNLHFYTVERLFRTGPVAPLLVLVQQAHNTRLKGCLEQGLLHRFWSLCNRLINRSQVSAHDGSLAPTHTEQRGAKFSFGSWCLCNLFHDFLCALGGLCGPQGLDKRPSSFREDFETASKKRGTTAGGLLPPPPAGSGR